MAISQQRPTLEEFLSLPELEPALEFECGRVAQKMSPNPLHGRLQIWLGSQIDVFAFPLRLAATFTETRVTFAGNSYVPDLVVYQWGRIPRAQSGEVARAFDVPPDIAVEILSPGQSAAALSRRCRWYVENGAKIALLIDPDRHTVRLFRTRGVMVLLRGDDRIDLDDVLPGFQLTVRQLFDALTFKP